MASQKEHSNVVFLFQCIESSKVKIDFGKVGPELGLKPNAARMRYARLRKSVEARLQRSSSTIPSQKRCHRPTTSKTVLANNADTSDEAGDKAGDNSETDTGLRTDISTKTNCDTFNLSSMRATRGNRVDYSKFGAEPESPVGSHLDDQGSEFSAYGSTSNVTPPREVKTPPRVAIDTLPTPPKSRQSTKQVSVSPQPLIRRGSRSIFAAGTPPYNAKRKKISVTRDLDRESAIRADLQDLATGQKISAVALKRRKLNRDVQRETCRITDSISPNDSISTVETEQYQKRKQEAVLQEPKQVAGTSFVQRFYAFWG